MTRTVNEVLVVGPVAGALDQLERLPGDALQAADAIAVVGDLVPHDAGRASYAACFRLLGRLDRPTFWVPGPGDAPIADYLREAANIEITFPQVHGVHGSVARADDQVLFAGMGGEIVDDADAERDERTRLRYPAWEAEYRLRAIAQFDEVALKVLLFTTPPAHERLGTVGSEVVKELIATYRARLAVFAGAQPAEAHVGRTLVVAPGPLAQGHAAMVDLRAGTVRRISLHAGSAVS